ncbi:MAG: amidohydrolase family protein [Planctomycetes bacterium]|nr:amidohydrolase family protein [Planctomycetota bacterium]
MRGICTLALAVWAGPFAVARAQGPSAPPATDYAIHCGRLLRGDGNTELRDAWLVVRGGKISSVGTDAPPADLPVIDARGKVVMPGIVAADSDLSGAQENDYNVTPDALAVDGFDFDATQRDALRGGVTTAYLSPGRERLVSGQGAAVKLAGRDVVARVLGDAICLRVNFGDGAVAAPRLFEPTPHPTADDPLLPARVQTPTSRLSLLTELRALFAAAVDEQQGLTGEGLAENQYTEVALADVVKGKLPVRAGAWKAADVRRALMLQKELGIRLVLENPQEIAALAATAASQKAAATFRMPILLGRQNPGGEDRQQKGLEPRLDAPAKAAAAGMTIAVGPGAGIAMADYLTAVAIAVRNGLPATTALRAIGIDAAKILGIDGRVGSLEVGKDADFVVLSGDPLAIGTMVESTWVDGQRVFERKQQSAALAVRCGRILDAEGHTYRNGTILVQDGRIKAVGEDLAIPYGAQVIDLPHGVMTPGLIDANSLLGLAGDGTGVPQGAANQLLHDAIAFDDPMFAPALAEGLTTVLVAGRDGGPVAGRIAAIKTGARSQEAMTVRAIAGLRLQHDGIGPDAIKPVRDAIEGAKKYVETWRNYDKAWAEWKSGKKPTAPPPPPPPTDGQKPAEDPVSGTWEADIDIQGQIQLKVAVDLELAGTNVTGKVRITFGPREMPAQEITSGSFENGTLKLAFRGMGGDATLEGKIANDTLTGKLVFGRMGEQDFTAKRTVKKAGGAAAPAPTVRTEEPKTDEPKKPDVNEALEPFRAAIEKRAALVIRTTRGPAITDLVELLEKEQIPYVLHGADSALDDAAVLAGKKPPVLLDPDVVSENDGQLTNAAAKFADLDLPVLLGTGDCAGSRWLPLHAAYAVRYGFSPADALLAVTANTARAFHLDDKIGSLRRGKDADFVVFSGDPFEAQSRVLLVVCNGEVVVDRREGGR